MALEAEVIKEISYPTTMDWNLAEAWADGIPLFGENDPLRPEWQPTPVVPFDLRPEGYGLVYIKDESDQKSNPTRTIKDRAAWELATLHRDYARSLQLKNRSLTSISSLRVPRVTYITAGNMGRALANMFEKYHLPPIKLLVDASIPPERLARLQSLHADIYCTDLKNKVLVPEEIKRLTNNKHGIDLTSVIMIEPQAVLYDWHVHEVFNENPDEIFVPYGSGRLFENYLTHQMRNARARDPRFSVSNGRVANLSILGAEPRKQDSIADKLTKSCNPFVLLEDQDIAALGAFVFTGKNTGVYKVAEENIEQAYHLLSKQCPTEPSGAAGLALYLQRFEEGLINPQHKILVVNTGKGI